MLDHLASITDLTTVFDQKSGLRLFDDGADSDRGDPLAQTSARCKQEQHVREHQRYDVGAQYKVAVSHVSWFRKRKAQEEDYNYEVAELLQTRPKCAEDHEHSDGCFQTLCMCFVESRREVWVNPAKNKCCAVL